MGKKKSGKASKEPEFEEAMERLEHIVRELEESDLPLEKSLQVFEEGVRLSRMLDGKLNEAEKRVEVLLKDDKGGKTAAPFDDGEDDDSDQEDLF